MTAHRFIKIAAVSALALFAAGGGAVAAVPTLRHIAIALANDPRDLPALETDPRIHFEPGAKDCAHEVAARLPTAIARVETAHGMPFARDVPIGVYASLEGFVSANAIGTAKVAGVAFPGRITLSPRLCGEDRQRMSAILTHELSHAHLQGWLSPLEFTRLPNWFKEGLAVMASDGGGAEGVSETTAASAITKGYAIVVDDEGSLFNLSAVLFETEPPSDLGQDGSPVARGRLAYRQAGMFVTSLRERDPQAFANFLQRVEDGDSFKVAFSGSFAASPLEQWRKFVSRLP
ncbi:MAG: hypothetical protein PHE55_18645 [Methylococcaceae bacterium]|nr:hypothetical protein [Methylococcaceae bacterium]